MLKPIIFEHTVDSAIRTAATSNGLLVEEITDKGGHGDPDFMFKDAYGRRYAVEAKVVRDGRPDRVISALCVAVVQASHQAKRLPGVKPFAVVYVTSAIPSMLRHVIDFTDKYLEEENVAIVTEDGSNVMRLGGAWMHRTKDKILEANERRSIARGALTATPFNPFSDLNQWMLKVLLAGEVSSKLLTVKERGAIYSGADLARAAEVSPMSANRLLQYLKRERYLLDGPNGLKLARREDFFSLWRSASTTSPAELNMRFRARVSMGTQLDALLNKLEDSACLGLFAAADNLGLGHASGAPPYIYVHRLPVLQAQRPEWAMIDVCREGQAPDFIVRRAMAPTSTFKGAVIGKNGQRSTDVIQVWLDVANHPTRGAEQADHIYRTVLKPLVEAQE